MEGGGGGGGGGGAQVRFDYWCPEPGYLYHCIIAYKEVLPMLGSYRPTLRYGWPYGWP